MAVFSLHVLAVTGLILDPRDYFEVSDSFAGDNSQFQLSLVVK